MSSARHMSPAEVAVMDALLPERLAGSSRELAQCLFEALVLADERAGCAAPAGDWAAQLQAWAQQVQDQLRHVSDRLGGFNFYLAKNPGFDMDARDRAMWDEFRGDYRAMAQKYGITEMRARQIIDAARREELAAADSDDLADLAIDELTDITGQSEEDARALIMKAREHWFADQE